MMTSLGLLFFFFDCLVYNLFDTLYITSFTFGEAEGQEDLFLLLLLFESSCPKMCPKGGGAFCPLVIFALYHVLDAELEAEAGSTVVLCEDSYFNGFQLFLCFKSPEDFKLQASSNPVKYWECAT